jgi:hypothetical protein
MRRQGPRGLGDVSLRARLMACVVDDGGEVLWGWERVERMSLSSWFQMSATVGHWRSVCRRVAGALVPQWVQGRVVLVPLV